MNPQTWTVICLVAIFAGMIICGVSVMILEDTEK